LTLDFTDVKTGWTECVAVRNEAQIHVFEAMVRLCKMTRCHSITVLAGLVEKNPAEKPFITRSSTGCTVGLVDQLVVVDDYSTDGKHEVLEAESREGRIP
jgi:hypothetical protein